MIFFKISISFLTVFVNKKVIFVSGMFEFKNVFFYAISVKNMPSFLCSVIIAKKQTNTGCFDYIFYSKRRKNIKFQKYVLKLQVLCYNNCMFFFYSCSSFIYT